jgi:hypothetical protein
LVFRGVIDNLSKIQVGGTGHPPPPLFIINYRIFWIEKDMEKVEGTTGTPAEPPAKKTLKLEFPLPHFEAACGTIEPYIHVWLAIVIKNCCHSTRN